MPEEVKKETKNDLIHLDSAQGQTGSPEKERPGEAPDQTAPAVKRKRKSILLYIIAGCVFLGGGIGGAAFLGYLPIPGLSPIKGSEPKKLESSSVGPTVKLSPLVINLKEESGRNYLKTTILLEVAHKDDVEEVQKKLSVLTDMVILTVGDKRLDDLKQTGFKENLKAELLTKIQKELNLQKVHRIYFDEFLFQ